MLRINGYVIEEVYKDLAETLTLDGNYDVKLKINDAEIYVKYSVNNVWIGIFKNGNSKILKVIPKPRIQDIEKFIKNVTLLL